MTLVGNELFVADTDALLRFPYKTGDTEIRAQSMQVTSLPGGTINHHWTKSLLASADGKRLFVGVGSNSNAAENGLPAESERAAVWEINPDTGAHRIYASGLRNPVGLAWEPQGGVLWVAVNERDELGDHLPPDFMTGLREGAFYGWPFSYYGQHVDTRVKPQTRIWLPGRSCRTTRWALTRHRWACAGPEGSTLPEPFRLGRFVGQHGSWNRKQRSGYKVIFVPFSDGKPSGAPVDVLTGFLSAKDDARGRPVGVAIDKRGALLVADDVGDAVWRVSAASDISTIAIDISTAERRPRLEKGSWRVLRVVATSHVGPTYGKNHRESVVAFALRSPSISLHAIDITISSSRIMHAAMRLRNYLAHRNEAGD